MTQNEPFMVINDNVTFSSKANLHLAFFISSSYHLIHLGNKTSDDDDQLGNKKN